MAADSTTSDDELAAELANVSLEEFRRSSPWLQTRLRHMAAKMRDIDAKARADIAAIEGKSRADIAAIEGKSHERIAAAHERIAASHERIAAAHERIAAAKSKVRASEANTRTWKFTSGLQSLHACAAAGKRPMADSASSAASVHAVRDVVNFGVCCSFECMDVSFPPMDERTIAGLWSHCVQHVRDLQSCSLEHQMYEPFKAILQHLLPATSATSLHEHSDSPGAEANAADAARPPAKADTADAPADADAAGAPENLGEPMDATMGVTQEGTSTSSSAVQSACEPAFTVMSADNKLPLVFVELKRPSEPLWPAVAQLHAYCATELYESLAHMRAPTDIVVGIACNGLKLHVMVLKPNLADLGTPWTPTSWLDLPLQPDGSVVPDGFCALARVLNVVPHLNSSRSTAAHSVDLRDLDNELIPATALGKGGYAHVFRVEHEGVPTAMKVMSSAKECLREIEMLRLLATGNSFPVLRTQLTHMTMNGWPAVAFGITPVGVSLSQYAVEHLVPLPALARAAEVKRVMCEVLKAVSQAHALAVVHLDVHPGNVLLHDDAGVTKVVLIDWNLGASSPLRHATAIAHVGGTRQYSHPALWKSEYGTRAVRCCDVYSCVLMYCALLFGNKSERGTFAAPWRRLSLSVNATSDSRLTFLWKIRRLSNQWTSDVEACVAALSSAISDEADAQIAKHFVNSEHFPWLSEETVDAAEAGHVSCVIHAVKADGF